VLDDLIKQGELVFSDFVKRANHLDQPGSIVDPQDTKVLIDKFNELNKSVAPIENPKSRDEVLANELKRTAVHCVNVLGDELEVRTSTPKEVMDRYSVSSEDFNSTKLWLIENRGQVLSANKRQLELYSTWGRGPVYVGSKKIREAAEALAEGYLEVLKQAVQDVFPTEEYRDTLDSFIVSLDSAETRSYASRQSKVSMLSTRASVYVIKGKMVIDSVDFIRLFGHEVLGHALNYFMTENSDLPLFVKENYYTSTSATRESVSSYFEKRLFDLLNAEPEAVKLLEAYESFESVYKRFFDTSLLDDYHKKLSQLGFWIMSNSKMDDYEDQMKELAVYSIEPKWVSGFLNRHRNDWNRSTGLLLPKVVSELRYSVDVVPQILEKKKPNDITKFERTLLTGAWSPDGLKEWVNLMI